MEAEISAVLAEYGGGEHSSIASSKADGGVEGTPEGLFAGRTGGLVGSPEHEGVFKVVSVRDLHRDGWPLSGPNVYGEAETK